MSNYAKRIAAPLLDQAQPESTRTKKGVVTGANMRCKTATVRHNMLICGL